MNCWSVPDVLMDKRTSVKLVSRSTLMVRGDSTLTVKSPAKPCRSIS